MHETRPKLPPVGDMTFDGVIEAFNHEFFDFARTPTRWAAHKRLVDRGIVTATNWDQLSWLFRTVLRNYSGTQLPRARRFLMPILRAMETMSPGPKPKRKEKDTLPLDGQ